MTTAPTSTAPTLDELPWIADLYAIAVRNLDGNTVTDERGTFVRAGGGYPDPWTRDASLNAWGAASVLRPDDARATLLRVCEDRPDGTTVIAQDEQWWDQVIWIVAAWQHVLATGDEGFLRTAFAIGRDSLAILDRDRFRPAWGLYAGPALMQDGISGYPAPPATSDEPTSFVLDYPETHEMLSLSTNVLYAEALRSLDRMADRLGVDRADFAVRADAVAAAVNTHLWDAEAGTYGDFRHGAGALEGQLDTHREAAGLALAVLFDGVPADRRAAVVDSIERFPFGVVNVWPHFAERYSDERPGRHNVICWPMVMGLVGLAEHAVGRHDRVRATLEDFRRLVDADGGHFSELYDAVTGEPNGGWQCGRVWDSLPDQTWSATSFIRLVHTVFGVEAVRAAAAAA